MYEMWKKSRDSFQGQFQLELFAEPSFNFGYCSTPKWVTVKPWDIKIIGYSINGGCWLLLALSIGLLTVVIQIGNRKEGSSYFLRFQSIFSSLIASGPTLINEKKKSLLFVVWMFACVIFTNYYSGLNTGFIIVPPWEDIMVNFEQIFERNYSVMVSDRRILLTMNATLEVLQTSSDKTPLVRNLLTSSFLVEDKSAQIDMLAFSQEKVVAFSRWPYVVAYLNDAEEKIRQKNVQHKRHCYLGKSLFLLTERYYGFSAPGGKVLLRVARILAQAGIFSYWDNEFWGQMTSKTVQDRVRVNSPTSVTCGFEDGFRPLHVEGKVLTVFFLWAVCLSNCMICFVIEYFMQKIVLQLQRKQNISIVHRLLK